jgi:membrane-associated phospholipid phosphatase
VSSGRIWIVAAWCAAFAVAVAADRPVATWIHSSGLDVSLKSGWSWLTIGCKLPGGLRLPGLARLPGNFVTFTLPATIGILILYSRRWNLAAVILVSGLFSGGNALVKWIVGRARPFQGEMFAAHPFSGGLHGLLFEKNLSFPSGDVCLAAATAISLGLLFPRRRWAWIIPIVVVALERVAEGAHYPSDVVAGAALGTAMAHFAWRLLGRPTCERR